MSASAACRASQTLQFWIPSRDPGPALAKSQALRASGSLTLEMLAANDCPLFHNQHTDDFPWRKGQAAPEQSQCLTRRLVGCHSQTRTQSPTALRLRLPRQPGGPPPSQNSWIAGMTGVLQSHQPSWILHWMTCAPNLSLQSISSMIRWACFLVQNTMSCPAICHLVRSMTSEEHPPAVTQPASTLYRNVQKQMVFNLA